MGSTLRTTHHQKRVPWCFFEREESLDVVGQLFSPSDFIVNNLFVEWKSSVARKLDTLDRTSGVRINTIFFFFFPPTLVVLQR